jgi:AraC-like DNA-binding protein
VPTIRGDFGAEITRVGFPQQLSASRFYQSSPTIRVTAMRSWMAAIGFLTESNQPAMRYGGFDLSSDEIIVYAPGTSIHSRTSAECRYGTITLSPDVLAATARTLTGRDISPRADTFCIRPTPHHLARLRQLHSTASRLAATAPDALSHLEISHALEEALTHAMIMCMTDGEPIELRRRDRHHVLVLARLDEFLATHCDRPLYLSEICSATNASERTLWLCCHEHLGMGPVRYLWLRRMHLARTALLLASEGGVTVTSIATAHGFWELGRFSVAYRGLFGETPLTTLRRPTDAPASKNSSALRVFA